MKETASEVPHPPGAEAAAGHRGLTFLVVGLLAYGVVQAVFFPSYYAAADEGCYVGMAFMFARGHVTAEAIDDMNFEHYRRVDGRLVSVQDPGLPLLMVPLTWLGDRALFAFNMLVHAAGFVVFWLLVRRLGLHPAFCLLYLLHPTLWYFSRGIVNDPSVGVCLLTGAYFLLVGGWAVLAAGVLWGLAVFIRPSSAVFAVPMLLTWLILAVGQKRGQTPFVRSTPRAYRQKGSDPFFAPGGDEYRQPGRKLVLLLAGGIPVLVPILLYNLNVLHGLSGFVAGRIPEAGAFSLANVPRNLLFYGVVLNLVYPLMLVLFFCYRGPLKWPITVSLLVAAPGYLMYLAWGLGADAHASFRWPERLVIGPRYFAAILPLMVLAYASVLHRLAGRLGKVFWVPFVLGVAGLFAGDCVITVVHQRSMDRSAYFRDQLFGHTPKGSLVLMGHAARSRITGDVLRVRRMRVVFPFRGDEADTLEKLDEETRNHGEAYVAELNTGDRWTGKGDAVRDRELFIQRHPHETVLDVGKDGWRLKIIRVTPAGVSRAPSLNTEGES